MNCWIKSIPVNMFDGKFNTTVKFQNGLNIISGVNGTGKTELLKLLKSNAALLADNSENKKTATEVNIFAISPKRNTEKKTIDSILEEYKTQNKSSKKFIEAIKNLSIKDSGFENYSSFADLFVMAYQNLVTGKKVSYGDAVEKMKNGFNNVLTKVFPNYEIISSWAYDSKSLVLQIKKGGLPSINIEKLSTGERELFALLFNIFVSKDDEDIYLIDEPEIHLNWNLEKGLFSFLNWFCEEYNKQVIVTTHSRIIFQTDFIDKVQFLVWENNQIRVKSKIPEEERNKIAGEATEFLQVVQLPKKTFFVEDTVQELVLNTLAEKNGLDIGVNVCGNKSTVISLFRLTQKEDSGWDNSYFLIDGDNENINIASNKFITLSKYCIENYFFDPEILSKTFNKTKDAIKTKILASIKERATSQKWLVYKKLAELSDSFPFELLDFLDCGILISNFSQKLDVKKETLIKRYIDKANEVGKLDDVFREITSKF